MRAVGLKTATHEIGHVLNSVSWRRRRRWLRTAIPRQLFHGAPAKSISRSPRSRSAMRSWSSSSRSTS